MTKLIKHVGCCTAANGGAWMPTILGFAGLQVTNGVISVSPRLPKQWKGLEFKIIVRSERYSIEIT